MGSAILPMVLLVIGCCIFFVGLHDIDNSYNLQAGMIDNSMMISFAKGSLYDLGMVISIAGFLLSVISALSIFAVLAYDKMLMYDKEFIKEIIIERERMIEDGKKTPGKKADQ
jgi:Ca2+/H+ antiporter